MFTVLKKVVVVLVCLGMCYALGPSPPHISPYWADPDNTNPPNVPPPFNHTVFAPPASSCPVNLEACHKPAYYRPTSGHCNNPLHPFSGTSGDFLLRFVPAVYDHGMMRLKSVMGGLLPNPRVVSLLVRNLPPQPDNHNSQLFMDLGQFLDHDFSITTVIKDSSGAKLNCRPCVSWQNVACAPIPLPLYDPVIPPFIENSDERRCISFTRSVGELTVEDGRKVLEQPNFKTAFIDLSPIYGSDDCTLSDLRLFTNGLLNNDNNKLMQKPREYFSVCMAESGFCFRSGDERANENLGLTVMHMIFSREHNRLATALHGINLHWNDEKLFQEARRINIAQFEHLIFKEYLTALLGEGMVEEKGLALDKEGFYQGFQESIKVGVYQGFTTAAFRMGHSQIEGYFSLLDEQYRLIETVGLVSTFHNTTILLKPGLMDAVLRGLMTTTLHPVDLEVAEEVIDELFQLKDQPHSGLDLFAINIARGRDHGLAPYTSYLARCGILNVTSFRDLLGVIPASSVAALAQAYASVYDIDLYVGGLAETLVPGGLVGPTFACIIALQFQNARFGDNFWYEGERSGFTLAQLASIRHNTWLSRILCDNMDAHDALLPAFALVLPNEHNNTLRLCSTMTPLDLSLWREAPTFPDTCTFKSSSFPTGAPVPVSSCLSCHCLNGRVQCRCNQSRCMVRSGDAICSLVCGWR